MMDVEALRENLLEFLRGGEAHRGVLDVAADMPVDKRGVRPEGLPYSAWELLAHMRLCAWDIVEFCLNPTHESPPWPEGYWPDSAEPPEANSWDECVDAIRREMRRMEDYIAAPETDLLQPLPHGDRQTPAREAMLLADHNAYHTGQLVAVRRLLEEWPPT